MPYFCPKCKAEYLQEGSCQERFDLLQAKELSDPRYYTVHYLSVPSFMLQHNLYSFNGWIEMRWILNNYINNRWTPEMARQHLKQNKGKQGEKYSYTRSLDLIEVEKIPWSCLITSVRDSSPEEYCEDVRKWATSVVQDSAQTIKMLKKL
jgi:hypothetical protein